VKLTKRQIRKIISEVVSENTNEGQEDLMKYIAFIGPDKYQYSKDGVKKAIEAIKKDQKNLNADAYVKEFEAEGGSPDTWAQIIKDLNDYGLNYGYEGNLGVYRLKDNLGDYPMQLALKQYYKF